MALDLNAVPPLGTTNLSKQVRHRPNKRDKWLFHRHFLSGPVRADPLAAERSDGIFDGTCDVLSRMYRHATVG